MLVPTLVFIMALVLLTYCTTIYFYNNCIPVPAPFFSFHFRAAVTGWGLAIVHPVRAMLAAGLFAPGVDVQIGRIGRQFCYACRDPVLAKIGAIRPSMRR
jgi:hypothetical protein